MEYISIELIPIICQYLTANEYLNLLLTCKRFGYNEWLKSIIYEQFTKVIIDDESEKHYLNNKLHRDKGPAVILKNGTKFWFKNGKLHNENGPAIVKPNGTKKWLINGKYHRLDGPAVIQKDGMNAFYQNNGRDVYLSCVTWVVDSKQWYKDGQPHRLDGPAAEYSNSSTKEWWVNGQRHRFFGPAIEDEYVGSEFYLYNKHLSSAHRMIIQGLPILLLLYLGFMKN